MYRMIKYSISILLCCITLISCENKKSANTLVVATAADNPPYEFIGAGNIVGLDIDVINAVAKHLGKEIVIQNMDFNGLLAALSSKNVDLVIAGVSVTPERKKQVDFSDSYISTVIAVVYRIEDNFHDISNLSNKLIGAEMGTIWEQAAKVISVNHNAKVLSLSNNLNLIEELKSGVVDAVLVEEYQALDFVRSNPQLATFNLTYDRGSEFAIAVPKGSQLLPAVNQAIRALKASGELDAIIEKWQSYIVNKGL